MYYIVWKNDRDFIGGIYCDENIAVKVCNENNQVLYEDCEEFLPEEIVDLEDGLLDHSGRTEDIWKCSKIFYGDQYEKLYFLIVDDPAGGDHWLYVCTDKEDAIGYAKDHFDNEHRCKYNSCDNCKEGFIKTLIEEDVAEIEYYGNIVLCEIFTVIVQ